MLARKDNILVLNESCNMNCFFCFNNKENPTDLDICQASSKIKEFSLINKDKIIITGGEPMICPFILDVISLCKSQGFKEINMQTNGVNLSYEKLSELKKAGLNSILISIHSFSEQNYNKITRTKGNFDKAIRAITDISNHGISPRLSYVINKYNYNHVLEDLKYCTDNFHKIDQIEIGYAYNFKSSKFDLVRYPDFEKQLYATLRHLMRTKQRFAIAYCGLPLCYLNGYEHYASQVFNLLTGNNFSLTNVDMVMTKTEKCSPCFLKYLCYGIPQEYCKSFGDKDIFPIFKLKEEVVANFKKIIKDTKS